MLNQLAPYRKFVVAAIGAVVSWVGVVVISEPSAITSAEWFLLLSEITAALGVHQISNKETK